MICQCGYWYFQQKKKFKLIPQEFRDTLAICYCKSLLNVPAFVMVVMRLLIFLPV